MTTKNQVQANTGGGSKDDIPATDNKDNSDSKTDDGNSKTVDGNDSCICTDCTCVDCTCTDACENDCDCEGVEASDHEAIVDAMQSGIMAMSGFVMFSTSGPVIYSMVNDTGLATATGIGSSTVLVQSDNPSITVSGSLGSWAIAISERTQNHFGVDIRLTALNLTPGSEYQVAVTGNTTAGTQMVLGQSAGSYSWHDNMNADASGNFALSKSFTYAQLQAEISAGCNIRIQTNGAPTVNFNIASIVVTETSSGGATPQSLPLSGFLYNQQLFPRQSTWNGNVTTGDTLGGNGGLDIFHFGSWNGVSGATWAAHNNSLSLRVVGTGNFGVQVRPNAGAGFALQVGDVVSVTGRVSGAASSGANRAMILNGVAFDWHNVVQSFFDHDAQPHTFTISLTVDAETVASTNGMEIRVHNNGAGHVTEFFIDSITFSRQCTNLANHGTLAAATCTSNAVACTVCGHQNAPVTAYGGHTFTPYNNVQHRCNRTVNGAECGFLENHSPNGPGQTCATAGCGFTQPIDGHTCTWGSYGSSTATCTAAGTSTRSCTVTGCTNTQTRNDSALGHNLVNNVCTRCNLTPCGMCRTVGDWSWGGNAGSHWAVGCSCPGLDPDYAPHFYNANGVCICGATGTPSAPPSACGMCRTVGIWSWGGNEDVHWSNGSCCTDYAPHSYNANGVCICGRTGTPGSGGETTGPASPCGMCGAVGPWSWGGNADVHWADNCNCTGSEAHAFNANGRCRCGATGAPGNAIINPGIHSPCGMCGVVGPWMWGGNEGSHWAENCNCTGSEAHTFNSSGRCRCGATMPGAIAAPQDNFREEDIIDTEALVDEFRQAIQAGQIPTIDLTQAGSVTVISAEVFHEIARLGVDVLVVLPNGYTFKIIASSITGNVGAFDLNIEVIIQHEIVQHITAGGGVVDVSANSIILKPNFHGEFGFELVFYVTAEQLAEAGITPETVGLFHVCAIGNVTDKGQPTSHDDGSISFSKTHASFYVLSSEIPTTAMIGSGVVAEAPEVTDSVGERGSAPIVARTPQELAEQAESFLWLLVAISAAAICAAAGVAIFMLKRRQNTGT